MQLAGAQKTASGAPGYIRWVNRPLGRFFASYLYVWGWSPNQVTALSATLTLLGLVSLAFMPLSIAMTVIVTALLLVGFALDSSDGQIARLRGGGSINGEWLDHVVDGVKMATLHLAILIAWYREYNLDSEAILLLPVLFAIQASVFYFSIMLTEQMRKTAMQRASITEPIRSRPGTLRSVLVLPADYGLFCLLLLSFSWQSIYIPIYALLFVANLAFLAASWWRWYHELRELDRLAK